MSSLPIVLGTVQLGGAYGVANRTGQPPFETAVAMIQAALDGGITTFDTAAAYGESEAVLGRALRTLGNPAVTVITKVQPMAGTELEGALRESSQRLGLERIPAVLFHREPDEASWAALLGLRDAGLVDRVGVSVGHDPGAARRWVGDPELDLVQVPANVLDDRQAETIRIAAEQGVECDIRSVFLQGLFLMPEEAVPASLSAVLPARRFLDETAREAGLTVAELAVRYVLGLPGDIRVVLGSETVEQVRENVRLAVDGPLPPEVHARVRAGVPRLPAEILTPGLWRTL